MSTTDPKASQQVRAQARDLRCKSSVILLSLLLSQCATATSAPTVRTLSSETTVRVEGGAELQSGEGARSARPRAVRLPDPVWVTSERSERPPSPVLSIAAGHQHVCAVLDDHRVWCWGRNDRGQCGQEDRREQRCARGETCTRQDSEDHRVWRPMRVDGMSTARSVSPGESVTCAIATDDAVHCWGYHGAMRGSGADRIGFEGMRAVRPVPGVTHAAALSVGLRGGCAVVDTGDVRCWNAGSLEAETIRAWRGVRAVFERDYNLCAYTGGDALSCHSMLMQLTGTRTVEDLRFVGQNTVEFAVVNSGRDVCARTRSGQVQCVRDRSNSPRGTVRLTTVSGLSAVEELAAGEAHYCARTRNGEVFCWGDNAKGQLGDGTMVARTVPVRVEQIEPVTAITAGSFFTCAIGQSGRVFCWGANEWGQLGRAARTEREDGNAGAVQW
ncbi:MAG: hypothetical protein Q8Q09_14280 [Deltaproteobacteria bacterium]|nr:hypothetical protein [Deltaproteobacteria bacterium]